jgi:hypothetical protein
MRRGSTLLETSLGTNCEVIKLAHAQSQHEEWIAQSIFLDHQHPEKSISAYRLGLKPASFTHNVLDGRKQWVVKCERLS